ncbi:DUF4342 domain-containing protein [Acetohalobium arabaticum]|uniref:Ubiquitin-associated-domain-containing protein n=1 Tax=Acetohalobium arabaticum (strain ATCC 49924 / DSM 5501 / Z-7288) TaxID=574087 RepID=D9QVG2_ACEAZ|nr:DUF4342 domain-containing protein [Acetohalobium arabaticum]ADL12221.1 ubiquitin-associated- domain-containing protein [Acetohalobium arabaticum DSM 5501]
MQDINQQLEKIDLIRERTKASYREAKEALEAADGDVLEAVVRLEEEDLNHKKEFQVAGSKLIEKIKELIKKGNVTKILVKKDGEIIFSLPVTVGVIGTAFYPPLAVLGLAATLVGQYTLEVEYNEPTRK